MTAPTLEAIAVAQAVIEASMDATHFPKGVNVIAYDGSFIFNAAIRIKKNSCWRELTSYEIGLLKQIPEVKKKMEESK